eukprot:UN26181
MLLDENEESDLIVDCLALADERVVQKVAWRIVQHYVFEKVLKECDFNTAMENLGGGETEELPELNLDVFAKMDLKIKEKLPLILGWVKAVGKKQDFQIPDLRKSLRDGKVLGFIFHHYLPSIISRDKIESEGKLERSQIQQNMKLVKRSLAYVGHCPDLLSSIGPSDPYVAGLQLVYIARRLFAID